MTFYVCSHMHIGIPTSKPIERKKKTSDKKSKKAKKPKGSGIVVDDLMAALQQDSDTKSHAKTSLNRAAPKHFNGTRRAKMEAAEAEQFKNVFQLSAFQSNPLDSIAQHIKNTVALTNK